MGFLLLDCSSGQAGVTYDNSIKPLFAGRCTNCHRPGGPSGVDIRNPFSTEPPPDVGLVNAQSQWKLRDPDLPIPDYDVKAGAPDESFLVSKISDPQLGLLPPDPDGPDGPEVGLAGGHMPLQVPSLREEEKELLEDWVATGATNGSFMDRGDRLTPQVRAPQMRTFTDDIQPIFGIEEQLNQDHGVCLTTRPSCAHCIYCHYSGGLNPPDLSDPFGPNGLVNIPSIIHPEQDRVTPGDPDASVLIHKIRQEQVTVSYGAPMPYSYASLTSAQVDLVRQWILEGARP
jgi:hypothetical protein